MDNRIRPPGKPLLICLILLEFPYLQLLSPWMKEEKDPSFEENDNALLVERYERMMAKGEHHFYDVEEFEDIMDHYMAFGKIAQAMEVLRLAKAQHPFDFDLMMREAELLAVSNKPKEALSLIEKVEMVEFNNPDVLLIKASILSQLGRSKDTIECLKTAARMTKENRDTIYLSLSYEYQNLERFTDALRYLHLALQANPANEDALYELAFCYDQLERMEESILFYQEFIDRRPYSQHAWYNLGNAYSRLGRLEEGIDAYDYAIIIQDDFAAAYFNKANLMARQKRYQKAIEVYKETEKFGFADALTFYYIGECFEKMEQWDSALANYRKAVAKDEFLADGWLGIGIVLDYQGQHRECLSYVQKAIDLDADNADYWYVLAEVQEKLENFEAAKQAFERVLALEYADEDVWLDYSNLYFKQGVTERAVEVVLEGMAHHPDKSDLYYRLTAYLLGWGREKQALEMLQLALEFDPGNYNALLDYLPNASKLSSVVDMIQNYQQPE